MDLHRPFKMDSPSYLPAPLASPALMVLASTAESGRDASVPCQAPRPFGVPVSVEKDLHLPFPSASYTFTSMYQRQGPISGTFSSRDFPASLLHLHPQFTPPNLDCSTLGMLNHSGVGAFRPFSSPQDERESGGYQSAFTPAKRLKSCFPEVEGKEFDFGSLGGSLKAGEESGRKLFSMSGLLSDGEASSSPEERKEHSKVKGLYDAQAPVCPVCKAVLRPGELQEHMQQELAKLAQLQISATPVQHDHLIRTPKSLSLSLHIKREGSSPSSPPRPAEEAHSDRYQTFLRVRANRHTRLNVDDLCWCRCYVKSAPLRPHSAGAHLDCAQAVRIGKLKRRKPEEGQEGSADLLPLEDDWNERRRIQMASIGFKGAMLVSTTSKECRDSDADLDVDGDDTLEYGRAQYTETDVIPCSGESSKETAVNSSSVPPESRVNLDFNKWSNDGSPSTSSGEKQDGSAAGLTQTCKNAEIEMLSEDSTLTTLDALKARIRDLEKQLSKGDRFKCLICMDTYTTPLTSIQCWHVHCEECWLRTLGAKKLCPQCNTITSPGDLRRVYL
ncbi:E3 ubiquitin-protein ligase RNF220 isoform X1 [Oreochromis niloticus]|uniref:E3 ubiquitin-protein ligase RNF220 n=1 Tax=Oreochromis aureus TaxID=47969 RepID=A0AAZ1XJI5_OREAU|nr:E3 ubiquitin-protein ligase RNF220 isoform X1 [Oreochromis niloticus]XP_025758421.1 E3 ubiquitin-protein ligase RNF220 isoform X1 [Oreochromis niloticus]XP_025758422.1 E3 ubiquitin-protein ligase RNF220 isoform X1 [Oreochromis niloticus]XP_025758423.1 E3 ubiquitin-protein ligase RNF220 isoform X1 [Oreochromis niloticus]XP_039463280.1 E3 ubiquitin-protein ligase RNF220 isoform X1 [Oreochromis aureus]